ncbi:MAG: CotH kinase family protein [Chitinophagales bacterium]
MLRSGFFVIGFFLSICVTAQPTQTFTGNLGNIPDNNTWVTFPVTVGNLYQANIDGSWGLEKVTLSIQHTYDGDLQVHLVSPTGTEVTLFDNVGGGGQNFTNTQLKQQYTTPITQGSAPFNGTYKPQGDLGVFNNGSNGNGTWYLKIRDTGPQDTGKVTNWSIRFGPGPATPPQALNSNLPIIIINTNGQAIPDNPKVSANFKIVDNGPGLRNSADDTVFAYNGEIGIEQRGSSSGWAPKLSYGFETWDGSGNEVDSSFLGFPAQSDWILSASYYDKTLMRNVLSYKLFNEMNHYASRTRYVELILNGQYQGVYMVMEKIKRDVNRVNVAKITNRDTIGDGLTGGYIYKIDKFTGSGGAGWYSNYQPSNPTGDAIYYQYEYPKDVSIKPQQQAYLAAYVDSFEKALFTPNFQDPVNGFRRYAGELSFMDYMLVNELSKNVDGYRLSTYFHKAKLGKIKAGPVWDYDITYMNADYCQAWIDTGWAYNLNYVCPGAAVPAHWERMMQDSLFRMHLRCRYSELRQDVLNEDSLLAWVDSTGSYLDESQTRNFQTWAELGVATWPEPQPIPQTYAEELSRLKTWLHNRLLWLDAQIYSIPVKNYTVDLGKDTTVCSGSLVLNAGTFDNYEWSTGATTSTIPVANTGSYAVTVSDEFGCMGMDAINVTASPDPVVSLGNDTTICQGNNVQLNAGNDGVTYTWSNGANGNNISVNASGLYVVTVINAANCTTVDSVNVGIQNLPDATFNANQTALADYSFNATNLSGTSYQWTFGDGSSGSGSTASHVYTTNGTFTVTLTVIDNLGCEKTSTNVVTVSGLGIADFTKGGINLFPNPANDMLTINTSGDAMQEIAVFDIAGKKVLQFKPAAQIQRINVEQLSSGTYLITVRTASGNWQSRFVKQ